ncbi:TauD/TfdA family dioxygenase [uncultured Pigmentiphaga sp.]|uniref:TauD/TfdA dioxygenase family protein n=1 Tax=uncultured Pigmentiphaga sp. TaxID=340361 RepID=UPI0026330A68|nr:TauD/TfdA family dioxygenase [uncultured Pigmentiphaga sp.]
MEVQALTPTVGIRITDFKVADATKADIERLRTLVAEHCVIHLPGQFVNATDLESFASKFGELWIGSFLKPIEGHRYAIPIKNNGKKLAISERWHADSTYDRYPPYLSFLTAINLPPLGGDTMWCNQYLVYEYLPDGVKKLISRVRAVHYNRGQVKVRTGEDRTDLPGFPHPLVIKHPITGKPVFYLSAHAEHLEGLSREESALLLDWLRRYNGQPAFSYRHQWSEGDLIIWDNRCSTHFAVHDYGDYPRYLNRVTVAGPQPEPYFDLD